MAVVKTGGFHPFFNGGKLVKIYKILISIHLDLGRPSKQTSRIFKDKEKSGVWEKQARLHCLPLASFFHVFSSWLFPPD